MDWQQLITVLALAAAIGFLITRVRRIYRFRGSSCGCGCSTCPDSGINPGGQRSSNGQS
ncbi:MAG: FeoB-associated Cys-rich membrane protein [Thermodesulfobacteriota bacterium]